MLLMSFSSGLPLALVGSTLQAWYTLGGVGVVAIGALSLVGQPYAFKVFWAPLMDRYVLPFLGRRRGWTFLAQVFLLIGIMLMGWFNPTKHPVELAFMALLVAFFSASQDLTLDAYRTDLLDPEERGVGGAVWANGYRIAMIISGAVALLIAAKYGWRVTYCLMGLLMLLGLITTLLAPEPEYDLSKQSDTLYGTAKEAFADMLSRKHIGWLLGFIALYKLGDAFALSLSSVFYLRDLHFTLIQVAWVGKTFGTVAGIGGIILGGALMVRMSLYRALMLFGCLQSFSLLLFCWLALAGKVLWLFATAVFVEHLTSGMGTIALFVLLMALCDKRFTATQYALLSVVGALSRIYIGPLAGLAISIIGWPDYFLASFILGLLGLGILFWLRNKVDFSAKWIR